MMRQARRDYNVFHQGQAERYLLGSAERTPKVRPVDAGPLSNARHLEALTALLLNLNRRYHATTSVQIVGLQP